MRMRTSLKGIAAVTCAMALAACASGGDSNDNGTDGEGETLDLWIMEGTNTSSDEYIEDLKEAFKDETGADLNVQLQPWDGAHDKFVTSFAGETAPDVAEVGTTWTPEFADLGVMVDLTDRVAEENLNLVESLEEAGTIDGQLYGMPWYAGVRSFLYNKELFDEAGIDEPPTSWDELDDAIEKLSDLDDVIPFPIAGGSQYGMLPFIWGAGGDVAVQEGDSWTSTIDSPEAVEGLEYYTDLSLEKGSSTSAADTWEETDSLDAFQDGDIGMVISGSWTTATIEEENPDFLDDVGAFVIPAKDGGMAPSFVGGSHLGVFENTENEDLAWELVKLMSIGDLAEEWADQSNYFPGDEELLDEALNSDDEFVTVFAEQMRDGGASVPPSPQWGEIEGEQIIPTLLQSVLTEKATAQEAAENAANSMNDAFEN